MACHRSELRTLAVMFSGPNSPLAIKPRIRASAICGGECGSLAAWLASLPAAKEQTLPAPMTPSLLCIWGMTAGGGGGLWKVLSKGQRCDLQAWLAYSWHKTCCSCQQ